MLAAKTVRENGLNLRLISIRFWGTTTVRLPSLPLCFPALSSDILLTFALGTFEWGGENWSHTARGVNLELGWRLTADLENADGEYGDRAVIDLNEKIGNEDGKLVYDG